MEDWIKAAPAWLAPLIAGLFTLAGLIYTTRRKTASDREQRVHEGVLRREESDHQFEVAASQDLTARFKALMEGYENRIKDLSTELAAVKTELAASRAEVRNLHQAYQDLIMSRSKSAPTS